MVEQHRAAVVDLEVELSGIGLVTPFIPAAGTLSKETVEEVAGVYGAVLPKTVTPTPRTGNPPPRLAEVASGMVNSIGLQNPGLENFLITLDGYDVGLPIFISIAADTVGEFAAMCERLADEQRVAAVELNLSCPNVEVGGAGFKSAPPTFCADPGTVAEVVRACRYALPDKPLFAKLTSEDVVTNTKAAEEAGADALTLINTVPALVLDPYERRVFLRGGLSGPAIKPIALRTVYDVSRATSVPVIGCGGVVSGTDVAEFMLAGATAVQVGSGSFVREPQEMLKEFRAYLIGAGLRARDLTNLLR